MRIDELKKKLEVIGEKYNTHFEVEQYPKEFFVRINDKIITRIYDEAENTLDTTYSAFMRLNEDLRTELFNIFIEYAKTPISEREEGKRYIVPLPGLVTTDGKQQYLTHREGRFFASKRRKKLRQTWKEKDLKYIPTAYRQYAVLLGSEEWCNIYLIMEQQEEV